MSTRSPPPEAQWSQGAVFTVGHSTLPIEKFIAWKNTGFRGFADYMQTKPFEEGLMTLIEVSLERRTVINGAEAVPWRCHRSLVADALAVRGIPVVEILSDRTYRTHKLTPFACVQGMDITYPPAQGTLPVSRSGR